MLHLVLPDGEKGKNSAACSKGKQAREGQSHDQMKLGSPLRFPTGWPSLLGTRKARREASLL